MHVAITDFTSYKASVSARYLKKHYPNIQITSIDCRNYSRFLRSKYSDNHVVLDAKNVADPAYADLLAKLVKTQNIDYLIPVNSQELGPLLVQRENFGNSLSYWGAFGDYQNLHDKAIFQKIVQQSGLSIPKDYSNLETAKLPFVYKPTTSSSSKGVIYVRDEEQRKDMMRLEQASLDAHVIQQYIKGEGVGFSGFFQNGKIVVGYAHKRLAEYPVSGGSSVYRGALQNDKQELIRSSVEKLLKTVPWSGFAMFEFKLTPEGELFFIECNPRIWGSIHQGLINGANYFSPLLGEEISPQEINKSFNTYLSPLLWVSLLSYAMKGKFSPAGLFLKNWRSNKSDSGLFRDPLGWLALVMRSF